MDFTHPTTPSYNKSSVEEKVVPGTEHISNSPTVKNKPNQDIGHVKSSMKRARSPDNRDDKPPVKRPMRRRICLTCDSDKAANQFPSIRKLSRHNHDNGTCRDCHRAHIELHIREGLNGQVQCLECEQILAPNEIKALVRSEVYERFEKASIRAAMAVDDDFVYCLSPTCSSGQLHDGGKENPIFRCHACGHKHCLDCELPWHENESCQQRKERVEQEERKLRLEEEARIAAEQSAQRRRGEEEEASEAHVKFISKSCPRCKSKIEKNGGCDHMTCRRCNHQFCWVCFADWALIMRGDNSAHAVGCIYHRPRPAVVPQPPAYRQGP